MSEEIQKTQTDHQVSKNRMTNFFDHPNVKNKFQTLLGDRYQAFITSLLQVVNGNEKLKNANPLSVYHAAATAASLNLPINQSLGFAWIVPYKGQAQFQMGYKGYIQLAQRSAQYERLNVIPVYKNQFRVWNALTEDLEADFSEPGEGEIVGYCSYFRLINGFVKTVYWTKQMVMIHAKSYSQSYGYDNSTWKTDFDKMAMKTVLKNMLATWGILSVEMQKAIKIDQAVINDEDGETVDYVDNEPTEEETHEEKAVKAADQTVEAMKQITDKAKAKKAN